LWPVDDERAEPLQARPVAGVEQLVVVHRRMMVETARPRSA
jgi:hypothetical protein